MLTRIRNAWRSWRNWPKEHEAAWAPYLEVNSEGLTRFQIETERRLVEVLMLRGLSLRDRRLEGHPPSEPDALDGTLAIFALIPELEAEVWISEDQTDITSEHKSIRLEKWDAKTPAEHMQYAEELLSEWLDSSDAA